MSDLLGIEQKQSNQCTNLWDLSKARFEAGCFPYIALVSAGIAVLVLASLGLRPLLKSRPQWLKNFAAESPKLVDHPTPKIVKRWTHWTAILIATAFIGTVLSIVSAAAFARETWAVLYIIPWVIALLVSTFDRPTSTPISLLVLYASLAVCQVIRIGNDESQAQQAAVLLKVETCLTFFTLAVILQMPMRDVRLGNEDISQPFTPPTYNLRSPEDDLSLLQWMTVSWMKPLIAIGASKQLNDDDIWFLPYEFQHTRLHFLFRELRGSVLVRLLRANGLDLIITSLLGILESFAKFGSPVIFQQLLRSIEDPSAGLNSSIRYAILILGLRLIVCQSQVLSLWFSRRCYERSRGEMITMIYEKTLSRKVFNSPVKTESEDDASEGAHQAVPANTKNVFQEWKATLVRKLKLGILWKLFMRSNAKEQPQGPASMGKILNLMRNDVYEVSQRFWECQNIITKPLGVILAVILIWKLLGWSCLLGVLCVFAAQLLNLLWARILLRLERVRRLTTDSRLQTSSQFVEAIRHLRWYDWQQQWLDRIIEARQRELYLRILTGFMVVLIESTNQLANNLFPVVAFFAYTVLAKQPLSIDVAFPALQLFNMLDFAMRELPRLVTVLLNASVALGRIEDFMNEPDKEDNPLETESTEAAVSLSNASFAWPGSEKLVLQNVNMKFPEGLTVICGRVGQGKSALLQAALGELDRHQGQVSYPEEMIGYCAQSPWLQSMSIRDNIIFTSPYDERRYKQTLDACALLPDLANFKHGDLSNIGENGIGLSGGQKARVALARAVYSRARILLLDDPLAALDHDTAQSIVQNLFGGPLAKNRCIVLATHRVDLVVHLATKIVEVHEGHVSQLDVHSFTSEMYGNEATSPDSKEDTSKKEDSDETNAVPDKFIEEEHRARGGVVASVYWQYVKAGDLRWWFCLFLVIIAFRISRVGGYYLLKEWGEAYGRAQEFSDWLSNFFSKLPDPGTDVMPWVLYYLIISVIIALFSFLVDMVLLIIVYISSKTMFKDVLARVSSATFRFYDTTPVGRLMNRLTSDFGVLDGNLSTRIHMLAWCGVSWLTAMIIIASTTSLFLIFALTLTALFVYFFYQFLPTSQSLRRLEMVSLTPLMTNFGILLDGLMTVRAFRAQPQFQNRIITVTDAFQKMDHFYWSLSGWLTYRFDALSAISTFVLTLLALYNNISTGLIAFILTTSQGFVSNTHQICLFYGSLQLDFVSVERVVELLHLEQENPGTLQPPAAWPSYKDDVVFSNATIRYAVHLDPALENVSFRIPGGSTTAIIGRTGSGKSTLALALLATITPDEGGSICIGDMDLAKVDVHALRQRVTFVAQDPVLFPGTLRQNLDPINEHSDAECESVLKRIFSTTTSTASSSSTPAPTSVSVTPTELTLTTLIATGGKNLSQGQRQLIGLGRAVLRRSAVVILDEATASIDATTASEVQRVLREELQQSTVIMIAHRVEAVREASWAIALDKGKVVAAGPAVEVVGASFGKRLVEGGKKGRTRAEDGRGDVEEEE